MAGAPIWTMKFRSRRRYSEPPAPAGPRARHRHPQPAAYPSHSACDGYAGARPGEHTMIRQYRAHRRRGGVNPLGVGVIATGSIYYLQDRGFFHDRFGGRAICRNPWIVEGFLNGTCAAARRNRDTGRWEDVTISGRSDTAVVRSLRDGRQRTVAVRVLELHRDLGLTMQSTTYPSVPDLSLYRLHVA